MGKLAVFNFITLNGYFEGKDKDTTWHVHGKEEDYYAVEMLSQDNILLFGRITYDLMVRYWTTEFAMTNDAEVAEGMNNSEKIVFSKTLGLAEWKNTRVIKENIFEEIMKLKETSGKNLSILGSGSIVTQFAEKGLIDEFQIMIDPVILGDGIPIVNGLSRQINLKRRDVRTFGSGTVLLTYEVVKD